MAPVTSPRINARRERGRCRTRARSSGASAIQANAGWPNFGKLNASRTPDRRASAKSNDAGVVLPRTNVGLELLVLFETACDLIGLAAIRIASDLHAIDHRRAGSRIEHKGGIALCGQAPRNRGRGGTVLKRRELHDPPPCMFGRLRERRRV